MGTEEHDVTNHAARRRRVLAGVLAGAALAVPGVAFAAGGSSSGSAADSSGRTPAITVQDEGSGQQRDGRDCPEGKDGGSSGSGQGSAGSQETAL